MRLILFFLLLLPTGLSFAQTPITDVDSPIVIYQISDDYDAIRSNLEIAITGRGMLVSGVLHISDMLNRTAEDTGLANTFYDKAESFEFCNLKLSWQMSDAHPANLSICPLTVGIYSLQDQPGEVFLSYQRPVMLGEAREVEQALIELYEGIIQEAME
ncbi:DUF302 domain-containing protein [Sedimenticola thiotaurini]|uniref:DUF302 domain-containing protein n=1 Tax=Sedimenticola thiotaurini TaxID=1543721 RepID=A0A0F7JY18_9GAMM|nr:DUF302 domain-containing protein [Sedimenticola thiotaurini]AKH19760.1 hypothetical protein AAY24_04610 [Sedimenticola thiotaurini]